SHRVKSSGVIFHRFLVCQEDCCKQTAGCERAGKSNLRLAEASPCRKACGPTSFVGMPSFRSTGFLSLSWSYGVETLKGLYDTLPIIRTFRRESRLSVLVIRSKVNHSSF